MAVQFARVELLSHVRGSLSLLGQFVPGGGILGDRVPAVLLQDLGRIDRPEEGVDVLLDLRRDLEAVHLMRVSLPESTDTE